MNSDEFDPVIRRLTNLRKAYGMSQREVAERMGISQPHVSKVERGKAPHVSFRWVRAYAYALGQDIDLKPLPKAKRNGASEDRKEAAEADRQRPAEGTPGGVVATRPDPQREPPPGS
jgi:transcriptional regulator with XRE-family HTH domain